MFLAEASRAIFSNTERMFGGAGTVFGRAKGALMRAFRPGESLDIVVYCICLGGRSLAMAFSSPFTEGRLSRTHFLSLQRNDVSLPRPNVSRPRKILGSKPLLT